MTAPPLSFVTPAAMQRALRAELASPQYAWQGAKPKPLFPWLDKFLGWILKPIDSALHWVGHKVAPLVRWVIQHLFGSGMAAVGGGGKGWEGFIWTVALAALIALAYLVWRRRRAAARPETPVVTAPPVLDIANAHAADRAALEWFTQAERLRDAGDLRLAFRAAFLGGLAGLGQRRLIRLRRDRTNREYCDELRRRAQQAGELVQPEAFAAAARAFDEVWYGGRGVDGDGFERFLAAQRELANA